MSFPALRKATTVLAGRHTRLATTATTVPTYESLKASWDSLAAPQRASISKALDERMEGDWKELSLDEKRAAFYVSFGPHGPRTPRAEAPAGKVLAGVLGVLGVTSVFFYTVRQYGKEVPETMNREWQEKSNEVLLAQKANPLSGISSEGYSGKGMVQSD